MQYLCSFVFMSTGDLYQRDASPCTGIFLGTWLTIFDLFSALNVSSVPHIGCHVDVYLGKDLNKRVLLDGQLLRVGDHFRDGEDLGGTAGRVLDVGDVRGHALCILPKD